MSYIGRSEDIRDHEQHIKHANNIRHHELHIQQSQNQTSSGTYLHGRIKKKDTMGYIASNHNAKLSRV